MRLWVTRTQPGADATAARLSSLGHQPVVQPVLETRPLPDVSIDLDGAAAIAFTSPNGVAAFAKICQRRDLPVFTTGEGTAAAARNVGFAAVEPADGDVASLAALIAANPPTGVLVWIRPLEPAGDLAALLAPHGVAVRAISAYETVAVLMDPPHGLDAIMVHSPKAGRIVAERMAAADAGSLTLYAISNAAAAPLSALRFKRVAVAPRPDETALLSLLSA